MSAKSAKWDRDRQNPNDPLYVVLLTSRNKDNKNVLNFKERRKSFLYHIGEIGYPTSLIQKFERFVDEGVDREFSRLYVSVNARDPKKIKRELMHRLIDDNLPGQTPMAHMASVMAAIGAKKECAAERKWMFDFDLDDEPKAMEFCDDIQRFANIKPEKWDTPNGFAIVTPRGFDVRLLEQSNVYIQNRDKIELKRDDLLCVDWDIKEGK